ncbi:hypothetical protein [Rhodococcus koreensis]|uniref:hypothetical protein n=1 Tax=Rhodococcus koreensis TaxID=99653 RepID=UPI000AE0A73D|nr:hypothetical protein [Rhodococcus koreensis]
MKNRSRSATIGSGRCEKPAGSSNTPQRTRDRPPPPPRPGPARWLPENACHLCHAVDQIDADLRRLVEYLNQITRDAIQVTALQLAYARHGDLGILITSTYGGEIAAAKARTSADTTTRGTKDSFLDTIGSDTYRERGETLRAPRPG